MLYYANEGVNTVCILKYTSTQSILSNFSAYLQH